MLNRIVPRPVLALAAAVLAGFPLLFALSQYDAETGFTSLICFGPRHAANAIPEIRGLPKAMSGVDGYDGQFYVQIAVHPSCRAPGLTQALDAPSYRAKRILVPALCHVAGGGRPEQIVTAYALANLVFHAALVAGLFLVVRPRTVRGLLAVTAIAWTTGVFVSISRALLDLPAAALTFLAAASPPAWGAVVFAAALLAKDTSLLSVPAVAWPAAWTPRGLAGAAARGAAAVLPFGLWLLYVQLAVGPGMGAGTFTFGAPVIPLARHLVHAAGNLLSAPPQHAVFEFLAPVSLAVQAAYLIARPRPAQAFWRMGIGFALLFFVLSEPVWVEQIAYTRIVLPLPVAFNMVLLQNEDRRYLPWFAAGNAGLAWGWLMTAWATVKALV